MTSFSHSPLLPSPPLGQRLEVHPSPSLPPRLKEGGGITLCQYNTSCCNKQAPTHKVGQT